MIHYDFDLCRNEECHKREECKRYTTYKHCKRLSTTSWKNRRNIIHKRNMRHDNRPPEYSFLDSMGKRHIRIDVDIMTCNGTRYFTTFRYTTPVSFDFSHGWFTDCSGLTDSLFEKYPTLSNRNDIRICINDAKVVKNINKRMTK